MKRLSRRDFVSGLLVLVPVGAHAQDAIDARALVGVWRGTTTIGPYVIEGEMIFKPNGTFQRTNWWNGLMTWAIGPYTIAENWIHFEIDSYGPDIYQGVPQAAPPSETWMVDRFDGQTIEARIGAEAVVQYRRVG